MSVENENMVYAADLTAAWLSNPNTRASADDVPNFLRSMLSAVSGLSAPAHEPAVEAPAAEYTPAVSVRKSLANPDHIISLIDGKPYKTLRRHLSTNGLTPDEYRQRYGLKADYPMTAANYSEARRAMAKTIGLGRKPRQADSEAQGGDAVAKPEPKRRGRKSGAEALAASKVRLGGDDA